MNARYALPLFILALWAACAAGSYVLPLRPDELLLSRILQEPAPQAWLGFDDLGRAIADRVIMGARTSLYVALTVTLLSLAVGTAFGVCAAWLGGWCDRLSVLIMDVFLAFPGILLAIALAGLLGPGVTNAIIALAAVGWVGFARLARAQTLAVKQREHVSAAIALGAGFPRIAWRHLLPLIMAPLIVEATFAVAGTVLAEASLSFLGLGVQAPAASWGGMIRDGVRYLLVAPHLVLAPGVAVFLVVLSVNLLGDALRDTMDVRLRKAR